MNKGDCLIVGIAGGSGSGKTTMAEKLYEDLKGDAQILYHDYYYRNNDHIAFEDRVGINYDHPDSLETELMIEAVKDLKNGQSIKHPTYNFAEHTRHKDWHLMEPAKVIIVEGILIFENKELRDLFDIKIFIDTSSDHRFIRRMQRDVKERGRTIDGVIEQYLATVKPMHQAFVEPSKKTADIIVPSDYHNPVAYKAILSRIKAIIKKMA